MASKWTRPKTVPFPSIWHRFDSKKEINGVIPKFWVQDVPDYCYDTVLDLMSEYFMKDEPLCKYSNAINNPEAVKELRNFWKSSLNDRLPLVCFMENPEVNAKPIIAGINMTAISVKGEKISKKNDPYEALGVDKYLTAYGLLVLPEFRGQNIGLEILKAREPLCRAVGLKATTTIFTSIASQKLAEKAGFKLLSEIDYVELEKINPEIGFLELENIQKH